MNEPKNVFEQLLGLACREREKQLRLYNIHLYYDHLPVEPKDYWAALPESEKERIRNELKANTPR